MLGTVQSPVKRRPAAVPLALEGQHPFQAALKTFVTFRAGLPGRDLPQGQQHHRRVVPRRDSICWRIQNAFRLARTLAGFLWTQSPAKRNLPFSMSHSPACFIFRDDRRGCPDSASAHWPQWPCPVTNKEKNTVQYARCRRSRAPAFSTQASPGQLVDDRRDSS